MTVRTRSSRSVISTIVDAADLERRPYVADCQVDGCYYTVACTTIAEAWREKISHRCPRKGDPMNAGPSIIEQAWAQLDAQVDEIYRLGDEANQYGLDGDPGLAEETYREMLVAKARARGKAEILALLMAPYYATADEISVEAAARAQARATGQRHRTLGLDPAKASLDLDLAERRRACARGEHMWATTGELERTEPFCVAGVGCDRAPR